MVVDADVVLVVVDAAVAVIKQLTYVSRRYMANQTVTKSETIDRPMTTVDVDILVAIGVVTAKFRVEIPRGIRRAVEGVTRGIVAHGLSGVRQGGRAVIVTHTADGDAAGFDEDGALAAEAELDGPRLLS